MVPNPVSCVKICCKWPKSQKPKIKSKLLPLLRSYTMRPADGARVFLNAEARNVIYIRQTGKGCSSRIINGLETVIDGPLGDCQDAPELTS